MPFMCNFPQSTAAVTGYVCLHYLYSFEFALLLQRDFSFLNFARSFPKVGSFVWSFSVCPRFSCCRVTWIISAESRSAPSVPYFPVIKAE